MLHCKWYSSEVNYRSITSLIQLKEKISELEEVALEQKPWQLAGEISAQGRPENSLLQEDLNFEQSIKSGNVPYGSTIRIL